MHPLINIAVKAARLAGKYIVESQGNVGNLTLIVKGRNDFATQVDQTAESLIIETIQKSYPHHAILAEETCPHVQEDPEIPLWIIDPLDGTTNFLHGFPQFCVSIAVKHKNKIQQGVIYDPIRNELFTANRGEGAKVDGKRLRVSQCNNLENALLGTGFPFKDADKLDNYLQFFKAVIPHCVGIRRAGAAALDLAYVAAGRLDGFWEFGLKPWDIAAGALLVQEAGGWISSLSGSPDFLYAEGVLAATPKIHQQMQQLYQNYCVQPTASHQPLS